jgi:hypothetical protein
MAKAERGGLQQRDSGSGSRSRVAGEQHTSTLGGAEQRGM